MPHKEENQKPMNLELEKKKKNHFYANWDAYRIQKHR
jgi:hypothetical protein